ncbi:MAG: repeat-like domain [Thermoplasmata archaeon]|jgi:hypothetical protein|nr:repeat-like domain [Thermoplasmata archaeon]
MRALALLLLAVLLLAGCATSRLPTATQAPLLPEAAVPLAFSAPVNMTTGASARETSLAIDPTNAQHLFACDPSGVPSTRNGHSYFYESRDGGASWHELQVETSATDPRKATFEGGDCDVAFDAAGTMYSADSWLGEIAVGSSSNGEAWNVGTVAAGGAPFADRPWLVGGPDGTVHLTYQDVQFGMPSTLWYTRSTDHARTFSPVSAVATATPDGAFTWTGNFVVSPDGSTLHSVYTRRASGVVPTPGDAGAERVEVSSSHDGGRSWSSVLVSARPASASYLYPAIARDAAGGLHVVFSQATSTDQPTWYTRSTDDGKTWSDPIALQRGVTSGSPWVAATTPGQAVAIWYASPKAQADLAKDEDWFLYATRIVNGTVVSSGPTTAAPLFHGQQGGFAEFNMVRAGPDGAFHVGASVGAKDARGNFHWQAIYQRQAP